MSPPNSDQTYARHPALTALGGPSADWIERILDITSRVNGEPDHSIKKLGRVSDLATLALVDELDVDPQDLIDQLERARRARRKEPLMSLSHGPGRPRLPPGQAPNGLKGDTW